MAKISGYMFRNLAVALFFITATLICAIWLMQSLRLVDMIINRGLPFSMFFHLSLLLLPSFLTLILPISIFAAVMYSYNRLMIDSELVVMRSAGVSQYGLAKPALILAGIVTVLAYSLTLYFLPASFRAFKEMQFLIRNDYSTVLLQEGVFTNLSNGVTVYVRERTSDGELLGVLVHDGRVPEKPVTMMAERGALIRTEEGPRVVMVNGNRQEVSKETGQLSLLYFDSYALDVSTVGESLETKWLEPRERFLHELFYPDMTNSDDQKNYWKLRTEGHQRLLLPLYILAFTLIGLASLLSGPFNRQGQAKRIAIAIAIVFFLQAGAVGFVNLAARLPWAVPLMYLNALLPLAASFFVLFGMRKRAAHAAPGATSAETG